MTLQQQVADLTAGIIPTTNSTEISSLQDQISELQEQLNSNSTATAGFVASLQSQIAALREQLEMLPTNSTSNVGIERLENLIEDAQETIESLTEDLENLEQDGVAAGALE